MLLVCEGFEGWDTSTTTNQDALNAIITPAFIYSSVTPQSVNLASGRTGGYSVTSTNSSSSIGPFGVWLNSSSDTFILGCAFKITSMPSFNATLFWLYGSANTASYGINVRLNTDGTLVVRNHTTVLGTTSALSADTWYYLEFKFKISSTAGTVEVRRNGTTVLSLSNVNTRYSTETTYVAICYNLNAAWRWDDLYVCDGSGSANNTFLGECVVKTLIPDRDIETEWSGSGSHYVAIGSMPYSQGSYLTADIANVGARELLSYSNIAAIGTIKGVCITTSARGDDAANLGGYKPRVVSRATESQGSRVSLTYDAYGITRFYVLETDPATSSAWTLEGINTLQAGVEAA